MLACIEANRPSAVNGPSINEPSSNFGRSISTVRVHRTDYYILASGNRKSTAECELLVGATLSASPVNGHNRLTACNNGARSLNIACRVHEGTRGIPALAFHLCGENVRGVS